MRVGLIGHSGFLGQAFLEILSAENEVICYQKGDYLEVLDKCDVIVNANGNSSKILAEQDPMADFLANALFTLEVSLFTTNRQMFLIHISSGEASEGTRKNEKSTYQTNSLINLSNYGLSKAIGEILVQKYANRWLIIRPSGLIGPGMKKGPIFDLLHEQLVWIDENSKLSLMRTSTTAKITTELLRYHLTTGVENQTYDVVSKVPLTLKEIAKFLKKELKIRPEAPTISPAETEPILIDSVELPTTIAELTHFMKEYSFD